MADQNQHQQQWELLASEGHVHLARLQQLCAARNDNGATEARGKLQYLAGRYIAGGIVLIVLALAAPVLMNKWLGSVAGWTAHKIGRVTVNTGTDAPSLRPLALTMPAMTTHQIRALTPAAEAMAWVDASIVRLNAGAKPEYCLTTQAAITASWLYGDGSQPICRFGPDRIWVWALTRQGDDIAPRVVPLAGVFRAGADGKWEWYTLRDAGADWRGRASIALANVPRAAAADLPELATNK